MATRPPAACSAVAGASTSGARLCLDAPGLDAGDARLEERLVDAALEDGHAELHARRDHFAALESCLREPARWASGDLPSGGASWVVAGELTRCQHTGRRGWCTASFPLPARFGARDCAIVVSARAERRSGAPGGAFRSGSGRRRRRAATPNRRGEQVAEAADAERLRRVVAGGDEVDAGLARLEHHALDRLAGERARRAPASIAAPRYGEPPPETIPTERIRSGPSRKTSGSRPPTAPRTRSASSAGVDAVRREVAGHADRGRLAAPGTARQLEQPIAAASSALLPTSGWPSSGRW